MQLYSYILTSKRQQPYNFKTVPIITTQVPRSFVGVYLQLV